MRTPSDAPDPFVMPPAAAPAPNPRPTQQQRQSEFEKDDWLPDGLRRPAGKRQPAEPCDLKAVAAPATGLVCAHDC